MNEELKKALGPYAWLKSGGQIVINYTEALTVIDVNSGKCEGKKDIEADWDAYVQSCNDANAENLAFILPLRLCVLASSITVLMLSVRSTLGTPPRDSKHSTSR